MAEAIMLHLFIIVTFEFPTLQRGGYWWDWVSVMHVSEPTATMQTSCPIIQSALLLPNLSTIDCAHLCTYINGKRKWPQPLIMYIADIKILPLFNTCSLLV